MWFSQPPSRLSCLPLPRSVNTERSRKDFGQARVSAPPPGAAGRSAPRVPACSGGSTGRRGRLPSPASDNHQVFARVNRAPKAAGGEGGGHPCLGFEHRPWQTEQGTGRSSTAGCGVAVAGLKPAGGRSRQGRTRAGPGRAGLAPGASNGGERGPRRGAPPSPLPAPRRRRGGGGGGGSAPRRPEERRRAVRPRSRGKRLPAGRRRSGCNCKGFPLDVCTANDN